MPPPDLNQLMHQALHLHQAGQFPQAEKIYRQICDANPRHSGAIHSLGVMAIQLNKPDVAINYLRYALSINPNFPQAAYNLGIAYLAKNEKSLAIDSFKQAIALRPDFPDALYNLGLACHHQDRFDESIDALLKAAAHLEKFPAQKLSADISDNNDRLDTDSQHSLTTQRDFARVYSALAVSYRANGQPAESISAFRKSLELRPDYSEAHSKLLFTMLFHANADPASLAQEHALWQQLHAAPLAPAITPHTNDPTPDRRLRIGYVSPDFTTHPVGRFMLPLLEHHDHTNFEIFCYSNVLKPDDITQQIIKSSDTYRPTVQLSHPQLAQLIRDDKIDILVDLTLHTDKNRLRVFARKPAPIQITYLGYVGTTGLAAIDYRFSDPHLDPINIDDSLYSEKTLRLNSTYWCYQPLPITPPVAPLPALTNNHITFGSLNGFAKVTPDVLQTWAKILAAVPDSRLLLMCPPGRQREQTLAVFSAENVTSDRIEFLLSVNFEEYFKRYHRIDIALDPFPYGGGTTTCDALYMGVPVISLAGPSGMARAGASILSTLNHPELLAHSLEHYLQIAITLAADKPRLNSLRTTLRDQMKSSPLMDAPRFAHDIESHYRAIWQTWCQPQPT